MDHRRRARDRPNLVGRRDVELGPRGRLRLGRDIASCRVTRHWLKLPLGRHKRAAPRWHGSRAGKSFTGGWGWVKFLPLSPSSPPPLPLPPPPPPPPPSFLHP